MRCGMNLLLNVIAFSQVITAEILGWLAGPEPEVIDGVGPWASTIDLDDLAERL